MAEEQKKASNWFTSTRKGIMISFAMALVLILTIGLVVTAVLGKMDWDKALGLVTTSVIGIFILLAKNAEAIATEDAAEKGKTTQ